MARKKMIFPDVHNFKYGKLEADNVYVDPRLLSIEDTTGIKPRVGMEKLLVVTDPQNGYDQIVNAVSSKYGLMRNEDFFPQIEERLDGAGIAYSRRSVNRGNRSFAVDYILEDESLHINVKTGKDKIKPMIRAINGYDGNDQTSGHFGGFREICSNGNHIADTQLNFQFRHRGNMPELVMPKIEELIAAFMDNEFYSLHKKFEVLAEAPIENLEEFVKYTLGETGLFKYEKSEKNPDEASAGANFIMQTIQAEAAELGTKPNLWLGYNAFNEYIHTQTTRVFKLQEQADRKIFDAILEQVN